MLFKTNRMISKAVRIYTDSEYDHISMVVRNLDPENSKMIHLFEAVAGDGVRIIEWDSMKASVGPNKHFGKVVYRKVDYDR